MATNNADNFSNPIGVSNGGTGVSTFTAYAPLCGGTTSTATLQQATTGISTSGNALISQGAAALPQWTAQASGGAINLIKTLTASSSSTLTFTSSNITSSFTSYMIVINNLVGSGISTATLGMVFSTNNGGVYLSTNYQSGFLSYNSNSNASATTNSTTNAVIALGELASIATSGVIYINIPQSDIVSYVGKISISRIVSASRSGYCFGNNSGTTTVNNIQFSISGETMTSGTISLYSISQ